MSVEAGPESESLSKCSALSILGRILEFSGFDVIRVIRNVLKREVRVLVPQMEIYVRGLVNII